MTDKKGKVSKDKKKGSKVSISTKGSKKSDKSKESKKKSKDSKSGKSKSDKSKTSKQSEKKPAKPKATILKFGIFSLTSSTGIIHPGEEELVTITSIPKESKTYEETITIIVSESLKAEQKGKKLKIHLTACEPRVNFNDLASIFIEQHVVKTMHDYLTLNNTEAHSVFVKSDNKLIFTKVCVNTTETAKLRIQNIGHVPAPITVLLQDPSRKFEVTPHSLVIEPYQTGYVVIAYTPTSLEQQEATLSLFCKGAASSDNLSIVIIGEPCAPQITLIEPTFEDLSCLCYLPTTLVGCTASKDIVFQNTGNMRCKVIVEIRNDKRDQLSLIPFEETIPFLNIWKCSEPMKHTNMVNLEPKQTASFSIKYEPSHEEEVEAIVKLHVLNNPFETKTIYLFCNGYYLDVILDSLHPYARSISVGSVSSTVSTIGYSINFDYVSINIISKQCFAIKNNSDIHTYKFEFPTFNEILFTPAVGHLRPRAVKQILAVFLSRKPIQLQEFQINCLVYKIEYVEPQINSLSWDDRQHLITWIPEKVESVEKFDVNSESNKSSFDAPPEESSVILKKVEENPEIKYEMVPNSWQNISLFVNVVADYAIYSCDVIRELSIPDTFVMTKQAVTFHVENPGKVPVKLLWAITMEDLPRRLNSSKSMEHLSSTACGGKNQPTSLNGDENFLYVEPVPLKRSVSDSTLFSAESLDTSRSADSWVECQCLPFSIEPEKVIIQPKQNAQFTVTFTPTDVYCYTIRLKGIVDNKSPDDRDIEIEVFAKSILPLYCFELEPTNYIQKKREGRKLCQDMYDENTKVVEFESIGVGVICTRKFFLKNPTKDVFYYEWYPGRNISPHLSSYHCHTSSGVVDKGKTVEIVFSFIPQDWGIFEEFYFFSIPSFKIQETFLLAGVAREARVYFDKVHIDLPSTVIGVPVSEIIMIKNEEEEDYKFKFEKLPMLSDGLTVRPFAEYVKAKEKVPLTISYNPTKRLSGTFDLKCFVDKVKAPLQLSVACNCFEIQVLASYIEQNGKEVELVPNKINTINLGGMIPRQKYDIHFTISNIGQIDFKWFWTMNIDTIAGIFNVNVDVTEGTVLRKKQSKAIMTVEPLIKTKMKPLKIYLKIYNGPVFILLLSGSAEKPPFKLSFFEHDFGPCLVQKTPSKYYKACLKFSNCNVWSSTLETGKHAEHVSTNLKAEEVLPQTNRDIFIYFHPMTIGPHDLEIPFYVDSKKTHVNITGTAVPLKLEFVNQTDKFIDLGSVLVGKTCTKTVRVLNNSECSINILFDFFDRIPKLAEKEKPLNSIEIPIEEPIKSKEKDKKGKEKNSKGSKKDKKDKKSAKSSKSSLRSKNKSKESVKSMKKGGKNKKGDKRSKEDREASKVTITEHVKPPKKGRDFITITPEKSVKVLSKKTTDFTITFQPKERVEPFTEKIFYRVQNYIEAFCIVKGSSIAPAYSLDRDHLTFGNVVTGFERTMNVVLRNTGDVPLKFKWLLDKNEENFSIFPSKGYVLAGRDLIFDILFKPKTVKCTIKSKLICFLHNINKQVELNLSGTCIPMPPPKTTLNFICPVRESDKKTITVSNLTNFPWEIRPMVSGNAYFKPQDILFVKGNSESIFEVTYTPLEMKHHSATLILPTPEGLILPYALEGIAQPPLPIKKIIREVLCKVPFTENLTVSNWLQIKQQFQMFTTINERVTAKKLFSVSGNDLIEVAPHDTRTYKWTCTPIIEGPLELTVTFMNRATKEYQFYEVSLQVLPNKNLDIIQFSTCVRQVQSKIIKLENPVNVPVVYSITCPHVYLEYENRVLMHPHSVYYLELVYKPLRTEHVTKLLEATCHELETYSYNVIFEASPPVPEPATYFTTSFGQSVSQKIDVGKTSDCTFQIDDSLFSVEKVASDKYISINFEPNDIGKFESYLNVKSTHLGEFIYPLVGECCSPKPQGPFLINAKTPLTINFKNPFIEEKKFYFHVEPTDFKIKESQETIAAKKIYKLTITMTSSKPPEVLYPITGKLMIYCKQPDIFWVYYLKEDLE